MRMDRYLPPEHPLSRIYRIAAAVFGAGLIVFGALGLTNQLGFFTTHGELVFGLATNGLLSVISIVIGLVLIAGAVIGGSVASTTNTAVGILFFLSGLVNLAVLETSLNLLAFRIQNVLFSLVVGMLLVFVGLYGRLSGGLPEDNPYVRYRHHDDPTDDHSDEIAQDRRRIDEIDEQCRAELAFAEGHPTPEQDRMVRESAHHRQDAARREARERHREETEATSANNPYY